MTIREEIAAAKTAELLTVRQVALLTQYSPRQLYRKVKAGEMPGMVRFGRGIRFRRTEILAWNGPTRDHQERHAT